MLPDENTRRFAREHLTDDPLCLLLHPNRYPDIDIPLAAQQIEGLRQAAVKWPSLAANSEVCFPPKLNREQSSSEATARFKAAWFQKLIGNTGHSPHSLADLTGGMGIDCLFAAKSGFSVSYIEQDPDLCALAQHNADALGIANAKFLNTDSIQWLDRQGQFDVLVIDPARRGEQGNRVVAFEDCTPNLLENLGMILNHTQWLFVKASPMIDLATAQKQLQPFLTHIAIVALHGECKEVLFACRPQVQSPVSILCTDINQCSQAEEALDNAFRFSIEEEQGCDPLFCSELGTYLYEPHAALMKGGPYRLLSQRYHIAKLAPSTHLYTSDRYLDAFPGRVFRIIQTLSQKQVAKLIPNRKCHTLVRNYPATAPQLARKLHLEEGGHLYIIGTTIAQTPQLLLCERVR